MQKDNEKKVNEGVCLILTQIHIITKKTKGQDREDFKGHLEH